MAEEPLYNFSRLPVSQTLHRDGILCTTAAAHSRFIALGTSSGEVLLVDPVRGVEVQRGKVHSGSVTGVAFDAECSWVGSCSEDGTAMVCKIGASEDEPLPQSRALQTICVPPDYARNDRRPVALGSRAGKVTVRWRPGHFNAESSKTYDMGAGPVRGMAWACNCLAWVQDDGVRIVGGNDSDPQGWKALIWTPPPGMSVHPEEKTLQGTPFLETSLLESCPPRLCWEVLPRPLGGGKAQGSSGGSGSGGVIAYLHIAWGDTLQTVAIREMIEVEAPSTPFLHPPKEGLTPLISGITPVATTAAATAVSQPPIQLPPPQQPPTAQHQQQQPSAPPPTSTTGSSSRSLLGGAFSSLTRTLTQTAAAMKDVATNAVAGGLLEAASAVNVAVAAVAALPATATGGLDSALKGNPVGFLPGMRSSAPVQRRELKASLVATGRVGDAWVAGLAVLDESFLLALTLEPSGEDESRGGVLVESKAGESSLPPPPSVELRVLSRFPPNTSQYPPSTTAQWGPLPPPIRRDALPLASLTHRSTPSDLHLTTDPVALSSSEGLPALFIVAPKDVIVGTPRTVGEHAQWCVTVGRLREAVEVVGTSPTCLPSSQVGDILDRYLGSLLEAGKGWKMAMEMNRVLPRSLGWGEGVVQRWEGWCEALMGGGGGGGEGKGGWRTDALFHVLPLPSHAAESPHPWEFAMEKGEGEGEGEGEEEERAKLVGVPAGMGIAQRCKPRAPLVLAQGLYTKALLRLLQVSPRLFLAAVRTWRGHAPSSSSSNPATSSVNGGDASSLATTPSHLAKDAGRGPKASGKNKLGLVDPAALLANAAKLWQVKKGLSDAGSMLLRGVANVANVMSNVGGVGGGMGGGGASSFGEGEVVMDGAVLPLFFEDEPLSGGRGGQHHHQHHHHSTTQLQGPPLFNCVEVGRALDEALALKHHGTGLPLAYLLDARADLHLLEESPGKALEVYLQHAPLFSSLPMEHKLAEVGGAPVGATAAISLLYRFNLWQSVAEASIQRFMSLGEGCVDAMVDGLPEDFNAPYPPPSPPTTTTTTSSYSPRGYFPLPRTFSQLEDSPSLQFAYLHAVFTRRQGDFNAPSYSPYHSTLLTLYPRFLPDSLLPFLLHSKLYPMRDAEDMCMASKPPLWRGLALVKVRSGYVREALDIYTSKLQDVPAAVDFIVSAGGDAALWADLLEAVVGCGEGEVVGRLLECLPRTGLSPSRVLNAIPPHLSIPHLQRRLMALLRERDAARRMNVITSALVRDDIMRQHEKTVERSRRGILLVSPTCAGCGCAPKDSLASKRGGQGGGGNGGGGGQEGDDGEATSSAPPLIHIFFCGHLWHGECLGDAGGGVGASSSSSSSSSLPSPSSSSSHPPLHPNAGKGSSTLTAITPSRSTSQGLSRSRAASRADVTPQYGGGWGNDTPEWGAPSSGGGTRSRTSSVLVDSRVRARGMSDAAPSPPSFSPRGGGERGGKAHTIRCPLCK